VRSSRCDSCVRSYSVPYPSVTHESLYESGAFHQIEGENGQVPFYRVVIFNLCALCRDDFMLHVILFGGGEKKQWLFAVNRLFHEKNICYVQGLNCFFDELCCSPVHGRHQCCYLLIHLESLCFVLKKL